MADAAALNSVWVATVTYAKDASSSSKTLVYFYPDDGWGGYCSLVDANKVSCDKTVGNLGQFSRGWYTLETANRKLPKSFSLINTGTHVFTHTYVYQNPTWLTSTRGIGSDGSS